MKIINVEVKEIQYNVYIGYNISDQILNYVNPKDDYLIIADHLAWDYHKQTIINILGKNINVFIIEYAEKAKTLETINKLVEHAIKKHFNRDLKVISFGGGAVGDLAGFFAATYKRGVKLIHMPTTILAHDSAIGGKIAVNYLNFKNIIGTFYQPEAVIYDLQFLHTLNEREVLSGYIEMFKHGLLDKSGYFRYMINNISNINSILNEKFLNEFIPKCVKTKISYFQNDVNDFSERQYLNLGHTLGHGIEKINNISHGEAVAFGLPFDLFLSQSNIDYLEIYKYFISLGLFKDLSNLDTKEITQYILNDKKNVGDKIIFIGLSDQGKSKKLLLTKEEFQCKYREYINKINLID